MVSNEVKDQDDSDMEVKVGGVNIGEWNLPMLTKDEWQLGDYWMLIPCKLLKKQVVRLLYLQGP